MPCLLALLLAIAASGGALGQSRNSRNHPNPEILVPEKSWELLGKGYHLTADSAVDFAGNVYFTDARRNRILKVDLDGRISTWKESSNGAHGIAFGPDGRLYAERQVRSRGMILISFDDLAYPKRYGLNNSLSEFALSPPSFADPKSLIMR